MESETEIYANHNLPHCISPCQWGKIVISYNCGSVRLSPVTQLSLKMEFIIIMKKILCSCLALLMLLTGMANAEGGTATPALVPLDALPEAGWQYTVQFPDWKGYLDDTLAMNSMFSFRFYHGQGTIYLDVAEGVTGFNLYVNGVKCDTSGVGAGLWSADISAAAVDGVNTLQVTNLRPGGIEKAVTVYIAFPVVLAGDAGAEGIDPETLRLIDDIIESDVAHGFTSAQLAVVKNGRLVAQQSWGRVNSYNPDGSKNNDAAPVTAGTMYDLASVTKMFAAGYAIQKLVTEGQLDLYTPVVEILGDAFAEETMDLAYAGVDDPPDLATQKAWKRSITLRDLLCHEAGFPSAPNYNDPNFDFAAQQRGLPGSNVIYAVGREATLKALFKTPLMYPPHSRTLYSDADYMLAAFIVERVTGQRLDEYLKQNIYGPLGLEHIGFLPLENGFAPEDCAATELNGNTRDNNVSFPGIRTETLQGQVHDERAWYCMEGVSGHAGLFASATDLAKLASAMLTGGYGDCRLFSRNVMDVFTAPKALDFGQWGLGWWRQGDQQRPWYYGTQAAPGTVGHQGWTGTLVMIDPSRELVVVYLTNKINSPVLSASALNSFASGCFTASTLGFVPQLLSIGMDAEGDVSAQLLDLLADMAVESLGKIPEDADSDHPYVQNAVSKFELLKARAEAAGNDEYVALAEEWLGNF